MPVDFAEHALFVFLVLLFMSMGIAEGYLWAFRYFRFLRSPFYHFLLLTGTMLVGWYAWYIFLLKGSVIDQVIIDNLNSISTQILQWFGFDMLPEYDPTQYRTVGIDGGLPLWIGDECDGLTLFAIFSVIIIAFPGKAKNKALFIPIGILAIHFLNIIRIIALVIITKYDPDSLDFNHTYVFQTLVYLFIFYLWYLWAKKYAGLSLNTQAHKK